MKQIISTLSFLVLLFVALPASAQNPEISVASFRELETDLTANIAGTSKIDQNGQTAALIKVVTTERGFNFDAGVLGIVATEQKSGEIWVYVPDGVRFLTISHPQLGILRSYPLPMQVKSGKTYELVLITGKVRTIVENAPMEQWVVFHVTPSDALLEFDDQIIEVDETGSATCYKTYGTYSYRAEHADYHPEIGQISVGPEKTVVDILMDKLAKAVRRTGIKDVAVAGGVSANTGLRNAFAQKAERSGWHTYIPKFGYTTDNAAMIAITGYYKYLDRDFCPIDKPAYSRVTI